MMDKEAARASILQKLARRRIWGAKHTSFEYVTAGQPRRLAKLFKEAAKDLIRAGYIIPRIHTTVST